MSGDTVLPVRWGLEKVETEDEGPLTVGLAVLQGKCGCSWNGSGEQRAEIETMERSFFGRWCPRYLLCCISTDVLRAKNKERALTFNSL